MGTLAVHTPVGDVTLFEEGGKLIALEWGVGQSADRTADTPVLKAARAALDRYFKTGVMDTADLKLDPIGTTFQKRVWREMQKIKPGHTKTYGQIAETLNSGSRAVGGACGANPLPILIPCHRVVGANGHLAGYSGGEGRGTKAFLLKLEGADI